jgi:hypothetical protein
VQNDVKETVENIYEISPKGVIATGLMVIGGVVVGKTLVRGILARKAKTSPLPPPAPVVIETTAR